jgi:DNA-binding transcriptional MocR family regulator
MPQHKNQMPFPSLLVDTTSTVPLFRQLYKRLRQAAKQGIYADPLPAYAINSRPAPALILGYTAIGEHAIQDGVRRSARALRA